MADEYWLKGLHFSCQQCSACCRHVPGFVFLAKNDILNLIQYLDCTLPDFLAKYVRKIDIGTGFRLSLTETSAFDCIFWSPKGCMVYSARPVQCRTYPFWKGIPEHQSSWQAEAADCPGINKGPLVPAESIREAFWLRRLHTPVELPYDLALEDLDENSFLGSERFNPDTTDT
ncbi:MAG: YkgJ family cysteine cluster protein [Spirochaetes bacterium]|nr:YkgJ family cysteine cluster protein [Spirochaetota bacterium]